MLFSIKIVTFENQYILMKKFLIPIIILILLAAVFHNFIPIPKVYITCMGVVVFMYLMMRLSSRIPSKDEENQENDV